MCTLRRWISGVVLLTGIAASAWGSVTGSISGVVKDPTGAVIPNAEVTVVNVGTNISQKIHTDSGGAYSFLALPVGRYNLQVTAPGLATYHQTTIVVDTNDQLRFDVVLKLGHVGQQVDVTASEVHVETANTQLGDVINDKSIEAMPLNGRMFTDLLGLQPGVIPRSSQGGNLENFFGSAEQGNVSINGQRESANG